MLKYKIKISADANNDIKKIIRYIKEKLKEPEIANQHRKAFKEEILKLRYNADIYKTIDNEFTGISDIRKVNVKNFMIFYRICEERKEVQIIAVYYSGSNWQINIKFR